MNDKRRGVLSLTVCAGLLALASPVLASAEERDSLATHLLDEVIISGYVPQRMTAPSGKAPVSLTWINGKELGLYRIQSVTDLTSRVPSLFIPDYGSKRSAAIYLRGSGARSTGQTIGLYLDGVPVLNKSGFNLDLPGIAGVEVLRGPQGTLYGRNAMSGIISYYTRSAFDRSGGEARLTAGTQGYLRASVEQALRLSETLGLSYGLSGSMRQGYFYNETTKAKQDSLRMVAGFAKLEYRPNDRLDMALSLQGDYVNQGGFPYRLLDIRTRKPLPLAADAPETYERHAATARYLVGYRVSDALQLQSATSYQYLYDRAQLDMDASSMRLFMADQRLKEHGFTQELILKGLPSEGAKYRWSAGLFGYYDAKKIDVPVTYSARGAGLLIGQGIAQMKRQIAARSPQIAARIPAYQYVPRPGGADAVNLNSFSMPDWGLALYHESALALGRGFTLTAGLRLDYERHDLEYDVKGLEDFALKNPVDNSVISGQPLVLRGSQKSDYWHLIPKLALQWQPLDHLTLHATITRGHKAGGFNEQSFSDLIVQAQTQNTLSAGAHLGRPFDATTLPERTTYRPEHSWSYELGGRYEDVSLGLRLEGSLYLMQVRDLQLTRFVSTGAGRIVGNAGGSRTLGVELSASKRLLGSLSAQASYSLTDARFTEETGRAKKGNRVPFIPQHTFSGMLSFNEHVGGKFRLFGEGECMGFGRIYWTEDNSTSEPLQTNLRARLGVSYDRLSLALWGNNLADRSYTIFSAASPMPNGAMVQTSAPRTLGVDLSIRL